MPTTPRPYRSGEHLHGLATSPAGSISVRPQEADRIYIDAAMSSHVPAYAPTGEHGSTILDIGRGVSVRVSGSVYRTPFGWKVRPEYRLHTSREKGGDLTQAMYERAVELVEMMISEWAAAHEGDIAQADDIKRNNAARTLEENIARHEATLEILHEQLRACEEGETYTQYPDLPTRR